MKKSLLQIVTSVTLFLAPAFLFAQAPSLGKAADFVLFTTSGAITHTGISQVTGNVGSNSGAGTGFGNVNGQMHSQDSLTALAAADLLTAYNLLESSVATIFPAPLLGNGDTLNAGIYEINAVTTLSSTLYLNANGNPNAVFIFRIQAAFSTNPSSKIKLINGAQACNVFWKVEGLVSMGTQTSFKGNIIAHNAAINMNVKDTLEGRALSLAGAIAVDGVMAYIPSGCGKIALSGPTAPNLGTAACYTLLSANGPVTNSGVSFGRGDIGTNVGLTTGYNPLFVDGMIHPIPDGSTSAAAADLLNAYTYVNTLAHDIQLLYPAQFGRNLVLTPHTYLMNAATTFTDSVYLNAEGNPDAVFVIKINGALTTSVNAKVLLINGTQSKNVYWKVEGAVSISGNSIIHGTIICNDGAINFAGTGDSLYGRALTTNGALNTAAVVSGIPLRCAAVPVTWIYFRGALVQKNVLLEWATTHEINNGFFTIEKSRDGVNFEKLPIVSSRANGSTAEQRYSLTDNNPFAVTYYRISQTDRDGQTKYYQTIKVKMNSTAGIDIQNYVSDNFVHVQISNAAAGNAVLQLHSIDGKKLYSNIITVGKEVNTYKINKALQKGIYLVTVVGPDQKLYNTKVVVR